MTYQPNQIQRAAKPLPLMAKGFQQSLDPLAISQNANGFPVIYVHSEERLKAKDGFDLAQVLWIGAVCFLSGGIIFSLLLSQFMSRPIINNPQPSITEVNPRCRLFCGD